MKRLALLACFVVAAACDGGEDPSGPVITQDSGAAGSDGGADAQAQSHDTGAGGAALPIGGSGGAGGTSPTGGTGGETSGGTGGNAQAGGAGGEPVGGTGGTAPLEQDPPMCAGGTSSGTCGTVLGVNGQTIYRTKVIAGIKYICTSSDPPPTQECRTKLNAQPTPSSLPNPWRLRVANCGESCEVDSECTNAACPNNCDTCAQDYPNNYAHCLAACGS